MGSDDKVFSSVGPFTKFSRFLCDFFEKPVIWFRETVVVPNRKEYHWYHEKIRRVPTVDECYTDDAVCIHEANEQFKLDRKVDRCILKILKQRRDYCLAHNLEDPEACNAIEKDFQRATDNFFIKYGDLGWKRSALTCFIKQKNRMAWERRHGPVGSGRKLQRDKAVQDDEEYEYEESTTH